MTQTTISDRPYTLHFGLDFDDIVFPRPNTEGGHFYLGPKSMLKYLEKCLGQEGHTEKIEHIRTEQFRQVLVQFVKQNQGVFFQASFEADQWACTQNLLTRRDELLLAGWDFDTKIPHPRLKAMAEIEAFVMKDETSKKRLRAGHADRFIVVLNQLEYKKIPISKVVVQEPMAYLPPQYFRLFHAFKEQNIAVEQADDGVEALDFYPETDLSIFKKFVLNSLPQGEKQKLKFDGSLTVLQANNDIDAAAFTAKLMQLNPDFQPAFLIPDKSRQLDDALIQNGLPSFGLPSASLGRPTLQLLKLVTTFLWRPIDPYKILEFVTLAAKPIDNDLANVLATCLSQRPGLDSEMMFAAVSRFFEDLKQKAKEDKTIDVKKIEDNYKFWFDRKSYDIEKQAPKSDIIAIFNKLKDWASEEFEKSNGKTSFLVLKEQAKRVQEILEELPENDKFLSFLELERIIRTVYESAPVSPSPREKGHYHFVHHESCLLDKTDALVWWNFTDTEGVHFFSKWYKAEIEYFKSRHIPLQSPQDENALMLWKRIQPILKTNKNLILIYPKKVNGSNTIEHPLFSHLHACFGKLDTISFKINKNIDLKKHLNLEKPNTISLPFHQLGKTPTFVQLNDKALKQREVETLTSLETLFYYPHQWVFSHKAKLRKSSILSIVKENTLKGNLAHRFFELILNENPIEWSREDVNDWIELNSTKLLRQEAATLLMYGFEPERLQFIKQVKYAVWTLITHIRQNNWTVYQSEMDLNGKFGDMPVRGKADVVLLRGKDFCVLDLKWSGHGYRERLIKNGADLQLVMYSRLLSEEDDWAHTAYFILENARLLSRNNQAFKEIKPLLPDVDAFAMNQRIWGQMLATYQWRVTQIEAGKIEIRTEKTAKELEEIYGAELLDILEMKAEDSKFDDYRTLIGLVV
jgi:ATP-dependent helicase/nuclease subunit B